MLQFQKFPTRAILFIVIAICSSPVFSGDHPRKVMSLSELQQLMELPEKLKAQAKQDPSSDYPDPMPSAELIQSWIQQYEDLTGTKPVSAMDVIILLRDHGDMILKMVNRPIRIGLVGFSAKKFKSAAAKQMIGSLLKSLEDSGINLGDVALISGLTDVGVPQAGYSAAKSFPKVETQGIAPGKAIFWNCAQVDLALILGMAWGAESPVYLNIINLILGIGGGGQAKNELQWFIKRAPDRTLMASGFMEEKSDGKYVPGAVDLLLQEGIGKDQEYAGGEERPLLVGKKLGNAIARVIQRERAERMESNLVRLALASSPNQVVEVDQWSRMQTAKYRVIRILNGTRFYLEKLGLTPNQIDTKILDLGHSITQAINGVDNFRYNFEWQEKVRNSFLQVGLDEEFYKKIKTDVYFASWFGRQDLEVSPGYFNEKTGLFKTLVKTPLDRTQLHTFDVNRYVELRLDLITRAFLNSEDTKIEAFLGTREELESFYRSKGYSLESRLSDSNNTFFYIFKNRAKTAVVIHGIDSESRLEQVAGLLYFSDISLDRVVYRGEINRLRAINRDILQLALMKLGKPIAGVLIGNRAETLEGFEQKKNFSAGPFRFDVVEVRTAGSQEKKFLVAFSVAYGEASGDIVHAAYQAGARNFAIFGAGGSLRKDGKPGDMHRVTKVLYDNSVIDLENVSGLKLLHVDGAQNSFNIHSSTPLEQTESWKNRIIDFGATDVDQETGPVAQAILDVVKIESAKPRDEQRPISFQSALYQSSIVGSGDLAASTVDVGYSRRIKELAQEFYRSSKIQDASGVKELSERPVAGAGFDSLSTTATGKLKDAAGSVEQFRGERRILQIISQSLARKDYRFLEHFLNKLNLPKKVWIQVLAADANHSEIANIAKAHGYDVIVVRNPSEDVSTGGARYVVTADKDGKAGELWDHFIHDGKTDAYEVNTATHYRLHLGDYHPVIGKANFLYSNYLDEDDAGDLALDINKDLVQITKTLKKALREHFTALGIEAPKFVMLDEIDDFLMGRQPILITGASKKSWPVVSGENQQEIERQLRGLIASLDSKKHVLVTGGTEFGVEEIAHRIANEYHIPILATLTENTHATEVSKYVTAVIWTGINWFGKSRSVLSDIVHRFNGKMIAIAGGEILKDEILLAAKLGVDFALANGAEGASTDVSPMFPSRSFRNLKEMMHLIGIPLKASVERWIEKRSNLKLATNLCVKNTEI